MFPEERFPLDPALWFATATAAPDTPTLDKSVSADIVIIGAGYAGLSTALHLAEQGLRPIIVDARQIGFGGSGRNGGQLVPGLKWDPDAIIKKFGPDHGNRLVKFAANTASTVFSLIDRYAMDVPTVRNGWIQPAHNEEGLRLARSRSRQWQEHGADVQLLSADETRRMLGSQAYRGGWLDKRGGGLQPLTYVRELARIAIQLGVDIYTDTPVSDISKTPEGWKVTTTTGAIISTEKVVVCTNAYSDGIWPGLKETVVDPNTYQTATEILPSHIEQSIFPEGHVASDTRNLLLYFRKDHTGRFIMGGRGPFREPKSLNDWAHLKRAALRMYPQLAQIKWEFHWCGRVAVTRDFYPHLHEPAPGLLIDIGCQGRGIGLQTTMGQAIAQYLVTGNKEALPVPTTLIKPIPLHNLRKLYVSAVATWYRLNDAR
ncbi:FAD-binding oxidoreductase [Allopusillimonas ginsengisoli]|nr:FAD-binding oxidoreductase [Allopusillimonas ginsengisoli]